ncbi:MAG: hypothetical protein ACLFRX_04635 [Gemmatimonadota bacterium]
MGTAIVSDPQSRANLLREMLRVDSAVSRTGARLRGVEGTEDRLVVRLDHRGRTYRFERGPEWTRVPLARTKTSLKGELLSQLERGWWSAFTASVVRPRPDRRGASPLHASRSVPVRVR